MKELKNYNIRDENKRGLQPTFIEGIEKHHNKNNRKEKQTMKELTNNDKYDILIELGLSSEAINCVLSINGENEDTYNDLLYYIIGYNDFEEIINDGIFIL